MKAQAPIALSVLAVALLIGGALYARPSAGTPSGELPVTIPDGAQVVTITAKGGYSPEVQTAKAGVPTVLRVVTNATYDCSTALRIPSLRVSERLPPNGETLIDLGTPAAGTIRGTCSMGMYSFEINFQA